MLLVEQLVPTSFVKGGELRENEVKRLLSKGLKLEILLEGKVRVLV